MKKLLLIAAFAATLFGADCDDAQSCFNAGQKASREANYALAFQMFKKSCEMGAQAGCTEMAYYDPSTSPLYRSITQDEFDKTKTECEAGSDSACKMLASFYMSGKGTKQNYAEAHRIGLELCGKGDMQFCHLVALLHAEKVLANSDANEAVKYYKKACEGGYVQSCTNLGISYLVGKAADQAVGVKYLTEGCEKSRDMIACRTLGDFYYKNGDVKKAQPYLKISCEEANNAASCMYLGISMLPKDASGFISQEAAKYFNKACALGIKEGCLEKK